MYRGVIGQIGIGSVLATLLCWVPAIRADFTPSTSGPKLAPPEAAVINSWIPYRAELSEVSIYLESAVRMRTGSGGVIASPYGVDSGTTAGCSDSLPVPQSNGSDNLNPWIHRFTASADGTPSGTSSRPTVERNTQTQTGLQVPQEHRHIELVTKVIADSKLVPGRPFLSGVFHPPRAFCSTLSG